MGGVGLSGVGVAFCKPATVGTGLVATLPDKDAKAGIGYTHIHKLNNNSTN